jgi:hypothetical protein
MQLSDELVQLEEWQVYIKRVEKYYSDFQSYIAHKNDYDRFNFQGENLQKDAVNSKVIISLLFNLYFF